MPHSGCTSGLRWVEQLADGVLRPEHRSAQRDLDRSRCDRDLGRHRTDQGRDDSGGAADAVAIAAGAATVVLGFVGVARLWIVAAGVHPRARRFSRLPHVGRARITPARVTGDRHRRHDEPDENQEHQDAAVGVHAHESVSDSTHPASAEFWLPMRRGLTCVRTCLEHPQSICGVLGAAKQVWRGGRSRRIPNTSMQPDKATRSCSPLRTLHMDCGCSRTRSPGRR